MNVKPDDVRQYGATAAIVLAYLRKIGARSDVPTLVTYSSLGRAIGTERQAAKRAVITLQKRGAVRIQRYRIAGCVALRMADRLRECGDPTADTRDDTTQCDVGVVSRSDPRSPRLDTVRALLDAVG